MAGRRTGVTSAFVHYSMLNEQIYFIIFIKINICRNREIEYRSVDQTIVGRRAWSLLQTLTVTSVLQFDRVRSVKNVSHSIRRHVISRLQYRHYLGQSAGDERAVRPKVKHLRLANEIESESARVSSKSENENVRACARAGKTVIRRMVVGVAGAF